MHFLLPSVYSGFLDYQSQVTGMMDNIKLNVSPQGLRATPPDSNHGIWADI